MNDYPTGSFQNANYKSGDNNGVDMMGMLDFDGGPNMADMVGGESLDDIVSQNSNAMRRRSMPMHYNDASRNMDGGDMRRVSMLDYSGSSASPLNDFQFSFTNTPPGHGMMHAAARFASQAHRGQDRQESLDSLDISTQMGNQNSMFGAVNSSNNAYDSSMDGNNGLDMDMTSPYLVGDLPAAMDQSLSLTNASISQMMGNEVLQPSFSGAGYASPMVTSPLHQDFNAAHAALQGQPREGSSAAASAAHDQLSSTESKRATPTSLTSGHSQNTLTNMPPPSSHSQQAPSAYGPEAPPSLKQNESPGITNDPTNWKIPPGGFPSTKIGKPHSETQFKNIYSSTGFDMLTVLMRVATRPNPEINIGAVDLSCAFVVCDAEKDDFPIVYCSENFERLTGYTRHMILGRNCRFLQSPDGRVQTGMRRKYVDDESVYYLKEMIETQREAQISLINYRRGGQPFMNLLTMIPLAWDTNKVKFFVGFQVDLVEQPSSMTNKNPDGSYMINYQRGVAIPPYVALTPENHNQDLMPGQSVQRDDVSALLLTYGSTDSEISKRMWDRILLENSDDVIHVLSLKGLFMYLSPSSRRILEYDPSELTGTALSSICHPSDIVPVTRELKESAGGGSINIVYRLRRKQNGYMWFDCHGALHVEQGKGRKCIIMVGRERPVYTLLKQDIMANGGIGDNELWSKLSTSGMCLFMSSNVRALLDRQPDDMIGVSIQSLMRQESKAEFGRILELARTGKRASVKHEFINKRGQSLQAFTTIYPGDALEGHKPTFLVAQTRMLRFSRGANNPAMRPPFLPNTNKKTGSEDTRSNSGATYSINTGNATPTSGISGRHFTTTDALAVTYSGQSGLRIGRQDVALASEENMFDELKTTRSTSWQYELRQMEKTNKILAEEVHSLQQAKKKRKRRKGAGNVQKDCANCHTRTTPEWRRGPSGQRDLCNSCGLRWAKQIGKVSPRVPSQTSKDSDRASKASTSPRHAKHPSMPQINENMSVTPTATSPGLSKPSAGASMAKSDEHTSKAARVESTGNQGIAGAIPSRIDTTTDPPD